MRVKKLLKESVLKKCTDFSDMTIKWLMNSLYLGHPVSGPYDLNFPQKMCEDHSNRVLYKQMFQGEYGPAGIVYSIEGSPPRGVIVVMDDSVIFYSIFHGDKPKIVLKNEAHQRGQDSFKGFITKFFLECWNYEKALFIEKNVAQPNPPGITCQPEEPVKPV